MTNKIYLSFNRLYTLKDGDYHGAKLSYRIKHGDQVIAEGEREGKSLSQFISPVSIDEMEITKPLVVEYVCTGNVEDVSAVPAMMAPGFRIDQSGKVFINNAFIKLAEDAHLIGGKVPKIGDHLPDAKQREKVKEIVNRYLTGGASEYSEEMIDELMPIVVSTFPGDVHTGGTLNDCKKRFVDSEPMPFGGFPGVKECQAQAAKPQLPEIISTNSEPFGVSISWKGSKNIPDGSKIQVQWIKGDYFLSTTDHKIVSDEKIHVITGLKAGEEVDCRLRVVSASGKKSEWSHFVKQAASSDAQSIIDNMLATHAVFIRSGDNTACESTEQQRIKKLVNDYWTEQITKMLQPGGLLSRR